MSSQTNGIVVGPDSRISSSSRFTKQTLRLTNHMLEEDSQQHQAELFYLQKQIQFQTPMIVVLDDGEKIRGCIEWYDRNSIKIRGRSRTLIYKSAIKYLYKESEVG
jgi:sRNA-binding regulator protein Hfq